VYVLAIQQLYQTLPVGVYGHQAVRLELLAVHRALLTGVAIGGTTITYTVTNVIGCVTAVTKYVSIQGVPRYLYTYTGTGANTTTGDNGPAYLATISAPRAMAADTFGNTYVVEATTHVSQED
jgi:hypothetical protein